MAQDLSASAMQSTPSDNRSLKHGTASALIVEYQQTRWITSNHVTKAVALLLAI